PGLRGFLGVGPRVRALVAGSGQRPACPPRFRVPLVRAWSFSYYCKKSRAVRRVSEIPQHGGPYISILTHSLMKNPTQGGPPGHGIGVQGPWTGGAGARDAGSR